MRFMTTVIFFLISTITYASVIHVPSEQIIISIDTIDNLIIPLPVPQDCITDANDSFQVMHSSPLVMENQSTLLACTPLVDGDNLCENICVFTLESITDYDGPWNEMVNQEGGSIPNPVSSISYFDDPDGNSYSWATSAYGVHMSDPFPTYDEDSLITIIARVTRVVWYPDGSDSSSLPIHSIYALKYNGSDFSDTVKLIDGYVNKGSDLNPEHGSMLLFAPSIIVENDSFIMIVNEDTSANLTALVAWQNNNLSSPMMPRNNLSGKIIEGNILSSNFYEIGTLNWALPGNNHHRHTSIKKLSDSLYIGFATPMADKDTCWFGYSNNFEDWNNIDVPILTGTGWLDNWVYTVYPLVNEFEYFWQLHLFVSGRGNNEWHTSRVDMMIYKNNYFPGDVNHDQYVNVADLVFMVNYLFNGGLEIYPVFIGDVDNDCRILVSDLVYMVNYLFKGGPGLQVGCH